MVTDMTIARLRWHAGFGDIEAGNVPSVSSCTYPLGTLSPDLHAAVADCLQTFAVLNREMNGDMPSDKILGAEEGIPRNLAYAVSEIARMIRDCQLHVQNKSQSDAGAFARFAWRIEAAWSAVLAGDIDNILEHVEGEEAARFN